jgi:pyridinium-3,5-biscarboxylic acid mononucleotide synthase
MEPRRLREVLEQVQRGAITVDDAVDSFRTLPFEDLGFAKIDHHRALRLGFPEVVLGQWKSVDQIVEIARAISRTGNNVLVTRVDEEKGNLAVERLPVLRYDPLSRTLVGEQTPVTLRGRGPVAVVTAGTSDLPVAEEAAVTARLMGNEVIRLYDVGVAGIHRVLDKRADLARAAVVIVVAGMEGALASVVGGLVPRPVVAVPTSIGYGVSFGGIAALLAMLNSCAAGVTVVNIDNGFGAAYAASLMNRREETPAHGDAHGTR